MTLVGCGCDWGTPTGGRQCHGLFSEPRHTQTFNPTWFLNPTRRLTKRIGGTNWPGNCSGCSLIFIQSGVASNSQFTK
jgi:hypothetical protein